jgi:2-polyprenyl-6-methoxyphenol hydroxylase-like FAD-dependent oxidoreductase
MLAALLGRHGVSSIVIEPRAEPTKRDESRAITWMPEGLLAADEIGITDLLRSKSVLRRYHEFRDRPRGPALVTLDMGRLNHKHGYTLNLPQGATEQILQSAALATGVVTLRRGWRVTAADDVLDGVRDYGRGR